MMEKFTTFCYHIAPFLISIGIPLAIIIWFIKKGWKYPTKFAAKVYKYFKEETKK